MLMPVREYNKHIAKIPNCKMRQRSVLRPGFVWMCTLPLLILLLLGVAQALDPAASGASGSSGNIGGGGGGGGGGGAASTAGGNGGASGGSLSSGGPPTLIANLTEQGSPGVYNNRQWVIMLITCIYNIHIYVIYVAIVGDLCNFYNPHNENDAAILAFCKQVYARKI
ncbi:LOW QUALITY PROTEIN: uncharacterized protein LOC110187452 [Drosophila serrata]|uniref:LOW QUALITY PROTEIN: uncharacterized protein LOC110187452 n=1 Tax=Drosophila serrata TaxID=7274 RepID=UPI000A1D2728|nr:LOW QUALITY PROTEIN: uncharacterized protein LOC110187452 [Drosophila serrata]